MKRHLLLSTVLLGVIALAGCDNNTKITAEDITHHRFVLTHANKNEVTAPRGELYIEFGENLMVSGQMCNRFFGKAILENSTLSSKGLAMTRMLCPEEQLNQLDGIISDLLTNGAETSLKDNKTLTLKNENNELVFQLRDLVE